jgi:RNA polymerase-binding protein DksA
MPAKTKTATTKTTAKPAARSTAQTAERRAAPKAAAKSAAAPVREESVKSPATKAASAGKTQADKGSKTASRPRKDQSQSTTPASNGLDIDHFRSLLLAERARMEAEREQIRNRSLDVDGALPEEGEGGDEDTADLASAMMDKEMDLSVEDEIEDMLSAIDHALQKMEDGTYGICDISGQPIPPSRLELIPWASLTVECQALSEGE